MSQRQRAIFEELQSLTTERRNPSTAAIDLAGTEDILRMMNAEDRTVADIVGACVPEIARAVELVVASMNQGGRLLYFGAGTSGRLGILDASECPPTFGVSPDLVVGVISGGRDTVFLSKEGVEDDEGAARDDVAAKDVSAADTVVGITASRRTPYVVAALAAARERGASTVLVTCNEPIDIDVDVQINAVVGPEAITGSTRLKAGTAQKMILNMITTATMVKRGKVYENLMVDLRPASAKLVERAKGIIGLLTGLDYEAASEVFEASDRDVKVAIVMAKRSVSKDDARQLLDAAGGFLASALGER